jgi:glycosyltransferase involved in cell wall biosynthesis
MGRPVISGDSAVIREALIPGEHIWLVPREDPEALAEAILKLQAEPERREVMARAGYERFVAGNNIAAIGRLLEQALRTAV